MENAKSKALQKKHSVEDYAHSQFHNMAHGGMVAGKKRSLDLSDLKGVRKIVGDKYGHSMDTYSKVAKAFKSNA